MQRYQRLVYTIVRRIGLDDHAAADVFQTVFSRLLLTCRTQSGPIACSLDRYHRQARGPAAAFAWLAPSR